MGRPVVLSNGSLFVGLNDQGQVHDFYYPYVGLDNLTTARSVHHKIGVWVDGSFSWIDEDTWQRKIDFQDDALISNVQLVNEELGIKIITRDFVDSDVNALCRSMVIHNMFDNQRDIRIFMHQVFQISRAGRADTALFVPDDSYLLDYKGKCCLLIYGQTPDGQPFDQYAIGNYGIEGKEGTFKDAEDGELSGNAVEHGGVDSVARFRMTIDGQSQESLDYWIIAAATQQDAERVHLRFKAEGLSKRLANTQLHWDRWFSTAADRLHSVAPEHLSMAKKSLLVVKAHIDRRGSILASGDSSIFNYGRDYYCYCWPRDGAYAVWPLIRLGFKAEPKAFFEFCRDVMHEDGYLGHKYQPDRAIGSTWHPLIHNNHKELAIQEDETAVVLYMLGEYYDYSKDVDFIHNVYDTLVKPAANFMMGFFDADTGLPHASYDLWEEKFATHTYTVALVQAALRVAARFAEQFNFPDDAHRWAMAADSINRGWAAFFDVEKQSLRKSLLLKPDGSLELDSTLDISTAYGLLMFADVNEQTKQYLTATIAAVEQKLLDNSPSGGVPRYENDWYMRTAHEYTGNPWFVCTLWLGQYYIRNGQPDKADAFLKWTEQHALPSGVLSEQVQPADGGPVGVAPLVWSHAEYINTILDLSE